MFYLTGDMTKLYTFIQGLLEWPISELFPANVSLWNQHKYIASNIFSRRILIILYKMLMITRISDEKNKWISHNQILNIIPKRHNILPTRTSFFIQVQKKSKACWSSKLNFSSSCFIVGKSYLNILWLHVVGFSKHDILLYWDNIHLFKYYPVKVRQNCFSSFNYTNQICIQVLFAIDK